MDNDVEQRMYDALVELAQNQPIKSVTVKQICELSGVSTRTFYNHFADKYELITWQTRTVIAENFRRVGNGFTWRDLIRACFDSVNERANLLQNLTLDSYAYLLSFGDIVNRSTDSFLDRFLDDNSDADREKLEFLLRYHFNANGSMLMRWLASGRKEDPDLLTDWTMDAMPEELRNVLMPEWRVGTRTDPRQTADTHTASDRSES